MRQMNNRQKKVVKARESVQKYLLSARDLQQRRKKKEARRESASAMKELSRRHVPARQSVPQLREHAGVGRDS